VVYLPIGHAERTQGLVADDMAEEEVQAYAKDRRTGMLLHAGAVVGCGPVSAVFIYLAVSVVLHRRTARAPTHLRTAATALRAT
jgi:hypothetical protein